MAVALLQAGKQYFKQLTRITVCASEGGWWQQQGCALAFMTLIRIECMGIPALHHDPLYDPCKCSHRGTSPVQFHKQETSI